MTGESNEAARAGPERMLRADAVTFGHFFNRRSFTFAHSLAGNPLFTLPRLARLADTMLAAGDRRRFLALGGESATAGSRLSSLPREQPLASTVAELGARRNWVKLSNADLFDQEYRELLERLLDELAILGRFARRTEISWSSLTVFLASPGIVTPYHMDHESNFLLQVAGEKDLFLFDGNDPAVLSEQDIERYYLGDQLAARYSAELQPRAAAYRMVPGVAAHHPPLAPHWVQNGTAVSVSVSIGFCMRSFDRRARIYQVNHYLRRLGLSPATPGRSALRDRLKSGALGLLAKRRPVTPDDVMYSGLRRLRALMAPVSRARRALRGR
jgi:hypothetical protein